MVEQNENEGMRPPETADSEAMPNLDGLKGYALSVLVPGEGEVIAVGPWSVVTGFAEQVIETQQETGAMIGVRVFMLPGGEDVTGEVPAFQGRLI